MIKKPRRGFLIVVDGIDGSGKSTLARSLEERLVARGHDVVRAKEPTDGQWGKKLRASASTGRLSLEDEVDLFLRDRREHVETLIRPALDAGKVVIVDRYYFSTVAYQGARGLDPADLLARNEAFAPKPDLLVLLDVEPALGLERIRRRGDKANAFEDLENLTRVAAVFRAMDFPFLMRVDGRLDTEAITAGILEVLYDGPLHPQRQAVDCEAGRARTTGGMMTETLR